MAAKKSAKKAGQKAGKTVGPIVRQPHGGAIYQGAPANPVAGTGRPPSELRARLRGTMADRIGVVESIADGEPMQKMTVPLLSVMQHVRCPKCGEGMKTISKDIVEIMSLTIVAKVSASPRDRLSAIDLAAKYGLGTKDEISMVSPDVVARLERQAQRFIAELEPGALEVVRRIVDDVWQ